MGGRAKHEKMFWPQIFPRERDVVGGWVCETRENVLASKFFRERDEVSGWVCKSTDTDPDRDRDRPRPTPGGKGGEGGEKTAKGSGVGTNKQKVGKPKGWGGRGEEREKNHKLRKGRGRKSKGSDTRNQRWGLGDPSQLDASSFLVQCLHKRGDTPVTQQILMHETSIAYYTAPPGAQRQQVKSTRPERQGNRPRGRSRISSTKLPGSHDLPETVAN